MKFGLIYCLLGLTLVQTTFQQTEEVVVTLDPEGESIDEFETQVQSLAKQTFEKLASATPDNMQDVITDFSGKLGLSVANVVIFVNNAGIDNVKSSAQTTSAALETALYAAVSSSDPVYASFNFTELTNTVEATVTSVLKQLKGGKGINDVISQVANEVAKVTFIVVSEFLSSLSESVDETKSAVDSKEDQAAESQNVVAPESAAVVDDVEETDPAAESDGEVVEEVNKVEKEEVSKETDADVTAIYENGKFKFSGSGKTVSELQQEIVSLTETGFVKIENSDDPTKVANEFAVNITYFVGDVLLTVLNADDDVDKETEAEAISDAVGSALGVGVADSMGPLQMLDTDLIQNEIVAATFNAITSAAKPKADIDAILQKAAASILKTLNGALTTALDTEVANVQQDVQEPEYQVASQFTDPQQVEDVPELLPKQKSQDIVEKEVQPAPAPAPAPTGGVLQVGSDTTAEQTQENLSTAIIAAFSAIESNPTAVSNQAVVGDMLMAIAQAVGETIVSLTQSNSEDQISQTVISLFYNAIEEAMKQAKGPIANFDINGVVKSIGTGVSEVFVDSTANNDMGNQIQQVAGVVINIIVEELIEVVPGFSFSGNIKVVADNPSADDTDSPAVVEEASPTVVPESAVVDESAVVAKSAEIPEDQQIAIDKTPLPVNETADTTIATDPEIPANLPLQGDCLCFDEELFDAMVSVKVQEEVFKILKQNQLI